MSAIPSKASPLEAILRGDNLLTERMSCSSFPDSYPRLLPSVKATAVPRVVVLGDGGVGKTCLVMNFIHHTFVEKFDPTIEDVYRLDRVIDGRPLRFEILDTAGQEDFAVLVKIWSRMGDVSVICYDVFQASTFDRAKAVVKELFMAKQGWTPGVLVGNKIDLLDASRTRVVSDKAARDFATSIGWPFFETSAKTGFQMDEVFNNAIRGALWFRRLVSLGGGMPPDPLEVPAKEKGFRCILL